MRNIIPLTKFLSLVLIKQKATLFFILLSLIGVAISFAFAHTNIGVEFKLFKDLVLSMNSLFLHLISIFFTFSLLEKFKQGTISILPLSLNINRLQYLSSIFITIIISTSLIFLSFITIDTLALIFLKANKIMPFLLQVCLYYLSSLLLSFVILTIFFSLSASTIKSITLGIITFMVGNSIDELIFYYENTKFETMKMIINWISYIFPNFSMFDIQTYVVNSTDKNFKLIAVEDTMYFVILSSILLIISYIKFKNTKVIPNDS